MWPLTFPPSVQSRYRCYATLIPRVPHAPCRATKNAGTDWLFPLVPYGVNVFKFFTLSSGWVSVMRTWRWVKRKLNLETVVPTCVPGQHPPLTTGKVRNNSGRYDLDDFPCGNPCCCPWVLSGHHLINIKGNSNVDLLPQTCAHRWNLHAWLPRAWLGSA